MITLFHAPQSRSSRMIWLLEELGVSYEIRPVSIFRPMTGEGHGDPANPHPDKRVPAMVHDGRLLANRLRSCSTCSMPSPRQGLLPPWPMPAEGTISPGSHGMLPNWSLPCSPAWRANLRIAAEAAQL